MVMQANILYSPASGTTSVTGGGSMETKGGNVPRAFVAVNIPTYRSPQTWRHRTQVFGQASPTPVCLSPLRTLLSKMPTHTCTPLAHALMHRSWHR
jgi:hypothetical protein